MIEMLSDTIGTRAVDALGFLLAFALTALMDSMFRERLPHDHGRAFAVNGELSKGKARGSGLIFVLKYLENDIGGLANMQKINEAKAKVLYDYLDGQDFFNNPVEHRCRSTMNVTFTSPDPDLDKKFCAEAADAGFVNLKGHRLVGGMRASIYNAMPAEGINKLVDFMEKFRKENA